MHSTKSSQVLDIGWLLGRELPGLHALGAMYDFGDATYLYAQVFPLFVRNEIKGQILVNSCTSEAGSQSRQVLYVVKQPMWLCGAYLNYSESIASVVAVSDNEALCLHGLRLMSGNLGLSGAIDIKKGSIGGLDECLVDYTRQMVDTAAEIQSRKRKIAVIE